MSLQILIIIQLQYILQSSFVHIFRVRHVKCPLKIGDGGLRHKHEVDVGQHYHAIMSPHCTIAHKWYTKVLWCHVIHHHTIILYGGTAVEFP